MSESRNEVLRAMAIKLMPSVAAADAIMEDLVNRLDRRAAAASSSCSRCKRTLPLGAFGRDSSQFSALNHRCLECDALVASNNRKARNASLKEVEPA